MAYGEFAYVYDRLMADMPYEDWLAFADACWSKYGNPRTIVDLGCGTGTIAIPLAQRGYRVTGIDLSEEMLAAASDKSDSAGVPAASLTWINQDMRSWRLPTAADAVISFCDCLNYLTEENDLIRTFRQTYNGLNPGGLFVFDMHAPAQLQAYAESQPFVLDEDDVAYIWTSEWDELRMEISHEITFFVSEGFTRGLDRRRSEVPAGGTRFRRFEESHVQRAYPQEWVKRQLRLAGFTQVECAADFEWREPDEQSQRLFFIAVKE